MVSELLKNGGIFFTAGVKRWYLHSGLLVICLRKVIRRIQVITLH